ncbi:MAG: acyltransferase family protein [Chloroflexota bacterium]
MPSSRLGYRPALDGLRGVAVLAVMLHHLPSEVRLIGGFFGVDLFFVLSGFLITTLLLEEWADSGSIDLTHFYVRRALRIVPAFTFMLVVVALWEPHPQLLVAGLYLADFALALTDADLLGVTHAWTLAIEAHFYLVWPVLLLLALRQGLSRRTILLATALAGLASAGLMAWIGGFGAQVDRAYFGGDTHAFPLLFGCLVALAAAWLPRSSLAAASRPMMRASLTVAVAFGCWVFVADRTSPIVYLGTTQLLSAGLAIVVLQVVQLPTGPLVAVLRWPPLVTLGRVSYGLYLWHLPIYHLIDITTTGVPVPWLVALKIGISLLAAAASYRFIERPFLRLKGRARVSLTVSPAVAAPRGGARGPVRP